MELIAEQVGVPGTHTPLLLPTSLRARPGEVTVVAGDPGYGHVALALALAGRLRTEGSVTLAGSTDPEVRRRHVALVDVADVTSPEDSVSVRSAVAEQLALAGRPSGRSATRALLEAHELQGRAADRFESVPAHARTVLLMDVAVARADTRVLVVSAPDRLGGDPRHWWEASQRVAADGFTVIVQCTHATARHLGQPVRFELGVAA